MVLSNILFAAAEVKQRDPSELESDGSSVLPQVAADSSAVETGFALVFGTFAAIAIVVIIIAAIGFITAEGNTEKLQKSKKAVIYALLGLVISLSAEIIVFFVVGRLG